MHKFTLTNQEITLFNKLHYSWQFIHLYNKDGSKIEQDWLEKEIIRGCKLVDFISYKCTEDTDIEYLAWACKEVKKNEKYACIFTDIDLNILGALHYNVDFIIEYGRIKEIAYSGDLENNEWVEIRELVL